MIKKEKSESPVLDINRELFNIFSKFEKDIKENPKKIKFKQLSFIVADICCLLRNIFGFKIEEFGEVTPDAVQDKVNMFM